MSEETDLKERILVRLLSGVRINYKDFGLKVKDVPMLQQLVRQVAEENHLPRYAQYQFKDVTPE